LGRVRVLGDGLRFRLRYLGSLGVPMERMGELFQGHWWMGWRAKLGPQPIDGEHASKEESIIDEKAVPDSRVERV
jgi:hypothetical protein